MHDDQSPISFKANIARLPARGMPLKLTADAAQRAALAQVHDLIDVRSFHAELLVSNWKRDGVKVTGTVNADIVQRCTVTLEPIDATLKTDVQALFVPEGSRLASPEAIEGGEMLLDAEGEDGPETFTGDTIDVGQLAEEFFELAIDPYPRLAGVAVGATDIADAEPRGPLYEKLKALRQEH